MTYTLHSPAPAHHAIPSSSPECQHPASSWTNLPVARYRFTARVQQPLALPDYAGSLLRGQFGAALRQVACMTRQPTCAACPLIQTCPYTRIFEAPPPPKGSHTLQNFSSIPNPYLIEPPPRVRACWMQMTTFNSISSSSATPLSNWP